ncbi:hypothetical protein [Mycobacterium sp.]|uniref:hypothetical protein n=1 Tax=Mycobacterium sp. TaxID=1785 RepID=UPI003D0D3C71
MTILFSNHGTATPVATDGRVLVRSATELSRLTRDRGGTDLHTVEKVFFTDGKAKPALIDAEAVADAELVGTFRATAPLTIEASDRHRLGDADGFAIESVEPDRCGVGSHGTTVYPRRASHPRRDRHRV